MQKLSIKIENFNISKNFKLNKLKSFYKAFINFHKFKNLWTYQKQLSNTIFYNFAYNIINICLSVLHCCIPSLLIYIFIIVRSDNVAVIPASLLPTPFPRKIFQQAYDVQKVKVSIRLFFVNFQGIVHVKILLYNISNSLLQISYLNKLKILKYLKNSNQPQSDEKTRKYLKNSNQPHSDVPIILL